MEGYIRWKKNEKTKRYSNKFSRNEDLNNAGEQLIS
jgi:hypothetical protein